MKSTSISIPSKEKNLSYVTIKRCILHTKIHYYMLSVKKEKKMFDLFQLCHQFHLFRGYYSNKIVTNKEKSLTGRVKLTKRLALFKWLRQKPWISYGIIARVTKSTKEDGDRNVTKIIFYNQYLYHCYVTSTQKSVF